MMSASMSILDNEALEKVLQDNVDPFAAGNLKSASYELRLGNEYYTTNSDTDVKVIIADGEQFTIQPGQFALLITKETIRIPANIVAFISIKFSVKFCGLINVSGFHVDPGFFGRLKFSVYNAGSKPIVLSAGQAMFPIWFCDLRKALPEKELYDGKHNNQKEISADDISRIQGKVYSPTVLHDDINALEKKLDTSIETVNGKVSSLDTKRSVILTITGSIALLLAGILVNGFFYSPTFDTWRKQAQFEQRVDSLGAEANKQAQDLRVLQDKLERLEKNSSGAKTTNAKIEQGNANQ